MVTLPDHAALHAPDYARSATERNGSRAKVAKFLLRYRAAGVDPSLFRKFRAPVGLDLGAETPAEIGVAIVAELVRLRRGADRPAIPLADIPLAARDKT